MALNYCFLFHVYFTHMYIYYGASQVAPVVKNPPVNADGVRDLGLILGWGRSPGRGHGNPLQCSCPENPHGQRTW